MADFPGLGGSVIFDSVKSVVGLDRATRDVPARLIMFENVQDVICEGTIWDIQAEQIVVDDVEKIKPWILRDWAKRPRNWEERWTFSENQLKKLKKME